MTSPSATLSPSRWATRSTVPSTSALTASLLKGTTVAVPATRSLRGTRATTAASASAAAAEEARFQSGSRSQADFLRIQGSITDRSGTS